MSPLNAGREAHRDEDRKLSAEPVREGDAKREVADPRRKEIQQERKTRESSEHEDDQEALKILEANFSDTPIDTSPLNGVNILGAKKTSLVLESLVGGPNAEGLLRALEANGYTTARVVLMPEGDQCKVYVATPDGLPIVIEAPGASGQIEVHNGNQVRPALLFAAANLEDIIRAMEPGGRIPMGALHVEHGPVFEDLVGGPNAERLLEALQNNGFTNIRYVPLPGGDQCKIYANTRDGVPIGFQVFPYQPGVPSHMEISNIRNEARPVRLFSVNSFGAIRELLDLRIHMEALYAERGSGGQSS